MSKPRLRELLESLHRREALSRRFVLAALGLTLRQYDILTALAEEEGASVTALAAKATTGPPALSRAIFAMERAGMVRRERSPTDKRVHHFYLTGEGRRLQARAAPLVQAHDEAFLTALSPGEKRTLVLALEKISEKLQREQPAEDKRGR